MSQHCPKTESSATFAAIIPAGGSGSRSGSTMPKQYVELAGHPALHYVLRAFHALPECVEIVVAVHNDWRATAENCAEGMERVHFVEGGSERQGSIANALMSLRSTPRLLLVHDAARPSLSADLIRRVVRGAAEHGAAIPVLPIPETVKRIDDRGVVLETVPRAELRTAQTPQGFRRELLLAAYEQAARKGMVGTDDASLVEAYGAAVHVVEGDPGNLKITYSEDFERAERSLR